MAFIIEVAELLLTLFSRAFILLVLACAVIVAVWILGSIVKEAIEFFKS